MITKAIISAAAVLFAATAVFAQDYEMKTGEVISVNEHGQILETNMPEKSKVNTGMVNHAIPGGKKENDMYNEDGRPKIPGYKPSGNASVDEQNYIKAKTLFYQNNPEEYKKWEKQYTVAPHPGHIKDIRYEEFIKMPEEKKQLILCHPDKYKVVKETENLGNK